MKTFDEYAEFAKGLAKYNTHLVLRGRSFDSQATLPYMYPVLALNEEAGEVAGKVAKWVRKSAAMDATEMNISLIALKADVKKELGDVLYALTETARQFGFTLQDVVDVNEAKLTDRAERNVLVGEGDNR